MTNERYCCDAANAKQILQWIRTRGGILIWKSVNLANPGANWTTPYLDENGNINDEKPNWQCEATASLHITDANLVDVITSKEVKRFHVGVRLGSRGLSLKVTDAGSERIRKEVAKASKANAGRAAWYEFDYNNYKNAVIMTEDRKVTLTEWEKTCEPN